MDEHELIQKIQALEYRNTKLKALNRKLQIQLSERDKRILSLYKSLPAIDGSKQ